MYMQWRQSVLTTAPAKAGQVLRATYNPAEITHTPNVERGTDTDAYLTRLARHLRRLFVGNRATTPPADVWPAQISVRLGLYNPLFATYQDALPARAKATDPLDVPPLVWLFLFSTYFAVNVRALVPTTVGVGWDAHPLAETGHMTLVTFAKNVAHAPVMTLELQHGHMCRPVTCVPHLTWPELNAKWQEPQAVIDAGTYCDGAHVDTTGLRDLLAATVARTDYLIRLGNVAVGYPTECVVNQTDASGKRESTLRSKATIWSRTLIYDPDA